MFLIKYSHDPFSGYFILMLIAIIVFAIGNSEAAYSQDSGAKGDIEYGQYLAAECVTCHSATGQDNGIPPITGWIAQSFTSVVNAYKLKELNNPAMQMIAGRLDDEQIASLALYFASLPKAQDSSDN